MYSWETLNCSSDEGELYSAAPFYVYKMKQWMLLSFQSTHVNKPQELFSWSNFNFHLNVGRCISSCFLRYWMFPCTGTCHPFHGCGFKFSEMNPGFTSVLKNLIFRWVTTRILPLMSYVKMAWPSGHVTKVSWI